MEKIHQGIGFSVTLQILTTLGQQLASESDLYIILRSPSTDKQASASTAEVSYTLNSTGTEAVPTLLTIGLTATQTTDLSVGAYSLEIYKSDKSEMLYYEADFAFCIPSSASETNATTSVSINSDITDDTEYEDGLTVKDVFDFIEETATNNPLT